MREFAVGVLLGMLLTLGLVLFTGTLQTTLHMNERSFKIGDKTYSRMEVLDLMIAKAMQPPKSAPLK